MAKVKLRGSGRKK